MSERFCDVLDIRDSVDEGPNWPADATPTDPVQIDCRKLLNSPFPQRPSGKAGKLTLLRAVRTLRFVRAIQAACCIPGRSGLA